MVRTISAGGDKSDNSCRMRSDFFEPLLEQHLEAALQTISAANAVKASPMPMP